MAAPTTTVSDISVVHFMTQSMRECERKSMDKTLYYITFAKKEATIPMGPISILRNSIVLEFDMCVQSSINLVFFRVMFLRLLHRAWEHKLDADEEP